MNLHDPIINHFRLIPPQVLALKKLGVVTVEDLLYHFPARYGDISATQSISSLAKGDTAVVFGKISKLKTSKGFRTKIAMADGYVEDESGRIHCVWFNQPYLAKMTPDGAFVRIEGKVSQRKTNSETERGELYFSNPKIEVVNALPVGVGDSLFKGTDEQASTDAHILYPVYPESRGITSNWIFHAVAKIFKSLKTENGTTTNAGLLDSIVDPIPAEILAKYSLPNIRTSLIWIHTPMKREDAEAARKRFAFEEIFFIQLVKQKARKEYQRNPAYTIGRQAKKQVSASWDSVPSGKSEKKDRDEVAETVDAFVKRFPFEATDAQRKAIDTILSDFAKGSAMSRLLEGDVGSGKTAVAAASAFAIVNTKIENSRLQIAYMCPTEILATQHFESFIQYFAYLGIQVGLITGSGCRKFPSKLNPKGWTDISKTQLMKWVENGEIPIVIGTHALIQKTVKFKHLAYVIIDEQHRFGTRQRAELVRKEAADLTRDAKGRLKKTFGPKPDAKKLGGHGAKTPLPHLLSMTATPIPRTLALTIYGDLDLTLLDVMPHGRKPIITEIVLPNRRDAVYEKIRSELKVGRQAYIICPRIDEPDPDKEAAIIAKSVKSEADHLKRKVFPEYEIGILHSKMKPADKDRVMLDFKAGKIHILCATSVVEVGVNVPNATLIVIEGGERFGLAQLHQLRGRVIRSNHQAFCYVFTSSEGSGKNTDGTARSSAGTSEKTIERLKALQTAKNGFELAEFDLAQRGAGELSGGKQWGVSDIAMEALKNIKMVEAARTEAIALIEAGESLANYPVIQAELARRKAHEVHFE